MHRRELIQLLQTYKAAHPDEQDCASQFQTFVEAHTDCFERSLAEGHVTGSAWLVNRAGTHVLLTHHRKLDIWVQLGGHADGQTDIAAVAQREAIEESGIDTLKQIKPALFDIDIHRIPARADEPAHLHYDARFAFTTVDSDEFTVSDESHDLQWIRIDRLTDKTREESMLRMARKWLVR